MRNPFAAIPLVLLTVAGFTEGLSAEAFRQGAMVGSSPTTGQDASGGKFCFIGKPERDRYYSFDSEKPPPAPEEFDPRPFLLVDVLEVVYGDPPVGSDGKYQHTGLDLLVLGGRYPVPGLTYQFSGYWRKDPTSGKVRFEEEECRPLWGRWLAWLAVYVAVAAALVMVLHRVGVLLARRLKRSRA